MMTRKHHRPKLRPVSDAERVVWPVEDTPTQPLPAAARPERPPPPKHWAAVAEFLSVDGNARRYLDRHPECGPFGCPRCHQHAVRCADCQVAGIARQVLERRRTQDRRDP